MGVRVLAAVLDSVVVFLVWYLIIGRWGDETPVGGRALTGMPALLLMLATAAFWIFPEWLLGSTMGKWACDLKVTTLNGMSISFMQSLKRNVLRLLDFFPFYLPGFATASLTPNRQRLGDLWAKTIVVPKKAAKQ
ncbi:MAG TPA: RDD family protein [Verrucomicrobiae bacterium]|nr:RDD family protein [Verrucomicrobiae bacterium]